MKKKCLLALALCAALAIAGCGSAKVDTAAPAAEAETEPNMNMINPWSEITQEKAQEAYAKMFKAPEGASDITWMFMHSPDGSMADIVELDFTMDGTEFCARTQATGDSMEDITGAYYNWTTNETDTLQNWGDGALPCEIHGITEDGEDIQTCLWHDIETGNSYSLMATAKDLNGFDIVAVASSMFDETQIPGYNAPQ